MLHRVNELAGDGTVPVPPQAIDCGRCTEQSMFVRLSTAHVERARSAHKVSSLVAEVPSAA